MILAQHAGNLASIYVVQRMLPGRKILSGIFTGKYTKILPGIFVMCVARNWVRGCAFLDLAGLVPMVRNSNLGEGARR